MIKINLLSEAKPAKKKKGVSALGGAGRLNLFLLLGGLLIGLLVVGVQWWVESARLKEQEEKNRLAQQEVFGPVLAAMAFHDEDEAVALANGTPFGLVAGLWTRDGARQLRMARRIASGQVFINNYGAGGGVELPFGGVKSSGHGREKGFEALYGFTTLKTVAIRHD